VQASALFSEGQRAHVLDNLAAMRSNLGRIQTADNASQANLREAVSIRLAILDDNVQGFISAADIDRRERYASIKLLLSDVTSVAAALGGAEEERLNGIVAALESLVAPLQGGERGERRQQLEAKLQAQLEALHTEMAGEGDAEACGSCYGAAPDGSCCNTCDDVRAAYRKKRWGMPPMSSIPQCAREERRRAVSHDGGEGCNLYGTLEVARVTGTLTLAPVSLVHAPKSLLALALPTSRQQATEPGRFNVTHQIKKLSFGRDFPGQQSPLDGAWTHSPGGAAVARYFLKVVPTTYEFLSGEALHSSQYSTTQHFKELGPDSALTPSVQFTFELTPLRVSKREERGGSLLVFLTRSAAVIGGLFTVAGIVDSAWYHSSRHLIKMRQGKAA